MNQSEMQIAFPKFESDRIHDEIEIIQDKVNSNIEQPRPLSRKKSKQ